MSTEVSKDWTCYDFHGSFVERKTAIAKAAETTGFIRERTVDGKLRYFVLSKKSRKKEGE